MDPNTGEVFRLRQEIVEQAGGRIGAEADMDKLRRLVGELADATDEERAAIERDQLVLISEEAARRLQLGERELDRRRRRRKADKQARRKNR